MERWAFWENGRLMATVETRADIFSGTDILRFAVRPTRAGRWNAPWWHAVCARWRARAGDRCWQSTAAIMSKVWSLWRPLVQG